MPFVRIRSGKLFAELVVKNLRFLNWRDPANPRAGGAEVHVWKICAAARDAGWTVTHLSAGFGSGAADEVIEGIRMLRVGNELSYWWRWRYAYRRLREEVGPLDLVVDTLNKLPLFTPRAVQEPKMTIVHHLFGSSADWEVRKPIGSVIRFLESRVPQEYRSIPFVTGSESSKDELVKLGISADSLSMVSYGVEIEAFSPGEKAERSTICYIGRLKRYKQVDHLLRAAAAIREDVPNLHIEIAGTGDDEQRLQELARELNLGDTVTFYGYVSHEEKVAIYQRAWVACLPSVKEGFGLSIPEAALCATPTVGYDVPGIQDAIEDEKTGRLVNRMHWEALATSLGDLLSNRNACSELGRQARLHYQEFTWDRSCEQMLEHFERVITDRK